jgi:hypothetical protein
MFDPNKAQFSQEDLAAGAAADVVQELLRTQLEDGFQASDLLAILTGSVGQVMPLFAYLKSDTPQEYARKIIALGVMLERDNDWLVPIPTP